MGLFHTFQDECDAVYTNENWWPAEYQYYNGDGVLDTAAHKKSSGNCNVVADTCPNNVAGVDPGKDPTDNLMSYAYDSCRQIFTPGQIERMIAMYEHFRYDPNMVVSAPTDPPVAPTDPPVAPTDPPIAPTDPPVAPTDPPVAPTDPPVAPTDPPAAEPACINNKFGRDNGCEKIDHGGNKVCVFEDGSEPRRGEPGDKCVKCVNHREGRKDYGCSRNRPHCTMKDNSHPPLGMAGEKCVP